MGGYASFTTSSSNRMGQTKKRDVYHLREEWGGCLQLDNFVDTESQTYEVFKSDRISFSNKFVLSHVTLTIEIHLYAVKILFY